MSSARRWTDAAAYLRLSRSYRRALMNTQLQKWQKHVHGIVLDVGGEKKSLVSYAFPGASRACQWLYLNIDPAKTPDIVADGGHVPFAAQSMDTIICMETMEHVDDPRQVLQELVRVLRPAGMLLLSLPFLYHIHSSPYDFWRFTEYGVQRLVRETGLEFVQLERLGRFFTVVCDMVKQIISEIRVAPLRWLLGISFLPLATFLVGLEMLGLGAHSPALSSFSTGYLLLAKKPSNARADE